MRIQFAKMQSLGNDFVVIDAVSQAVTIDSAVARHLADRHRGVGCDQVLVAEKADQENGAQYRFRIFNADGSEVFQCGNGARCFAVFLRERGLCHDDSIVVRTGSATLGLHLISNSEVGVDMGIPELEPAAVPFDAAARAPRYELDVDGERIPVSVVAIGNPHAVHLVPDVDRAPVQRLGLLLERHRRFPQRANVGFLQILDAATVRLRVFERGVGETQACGSGACAAVVIGRVLGRLDETVQVRLPGGQVRVDWPGEGSSVRLTGGAETVFEGTINVE